MSRRLVALLAVLPLAGCTASTAVSRQRSRPALSLAAFDSCAQLEKELRSAAARNAGPGGLTGAETRGLPGEARALASEAQAPAFSGTNVHEAGVDEPDLVKTDGRRIVTVAGSVLRVVDPAARQVTGSLDLRPEAGGPANLLLSGDRALVLMSAVGPQLLDRRIRPMGAASEILLIDLSGTPRLISRYRGDGMVVDARQNGSVARVVLRSTPQIDFPYAAEGVRAGEKAIASAPVDAWLPGWEVTTGTARTAGRLDCGSVLRPTGSPFSGTGMMRVLTFDLTAPALGDGAPVAVVSDGDVVYGTPASLYVANNPGAFFVRSAGSTDIFKFDLPAAGKPVLAATGKVPGTLINQYALSEWDGRLRVATTDPRTQTSSVRILDGKLAQVSQVGGLGKNERIYAVRFVGPAAYVVTFRQVDPLYVLDLADPAHPRATGELKISGYSAHLQPVGENRLIGIGQEASDQGRVTGTQVSLFDTTDPARPRRLAQQVVPGASSEAEYNAHAVLWWPATGLLVLPVAPVGALALHVTADGLREAGRIAPPAQTYASVRRALVVGDALWTVTDTGLLASNLSTLDQIAWIPL
nr:beta-propeller domain-containing protein [uncultured Actinoplanes sp.]